MLEGLTNALSLVCGQNADHTWLCAGHELPCCQRCTGLYFGALAAFLLLKILRTVMTNRLLWIHGAMLMLMVPFGFHWVPQDAILRAASGVLFGFGLVAFLRLPLMKPNLPASAASESRRLRVYWIGLAATLSLIVLLNFGLVPTALPVLLAMTGGAVALFGLAAANICLAIRGLTRFLRSAARKPRYE